MACFFFSSRRRHTRCSRDWSSDVCSSDLGTPYYMAPEQYIGGDISGAADQYSLGVVAYQCLGRRVPFEAASAYELLNKHMSEPPPPLVELRPDLPPHAYVAIERALAKRPEHRFATVADFVNTLAGRIPDVAAPRRVPPRRKRLIVWGSGIAAVAVALYAGATVLRRSVQETPRPPVAADSLARMGAAGAAAPDSAPLGVAPARRAPAPPIAPPPAQAPMAVLIIRLANGWARIYVDGDLRGERPVHREELPPGTHNLRFERPGFMPVDTTLTLQAGANVIEIEMRRAP